MKICLKKFASSQKKIPIWPNPPARMAPLPSLTSLWRMWHGTTRRGNHRAFSCLPELRELTPASAVPAAPSYLSHPTATLTSASSCWRSPYRRYHPPARMAPLPSLTSLGARGARVRARRINAPPGPQAQRPRQIATKRASAPASALARKS